MSDEVDNPKILFGFVIFPLVGANFTTGEGSTNNELVKLIRAHVELVIPGMIQSIELMCATAGIEFVTLSNEAVRAAIKHSLEQQPLNSDMYVQLNKDLEVTSVSASRRSDHH